MKKEAEMKVLNQNNQNQYIEALSSLNRMKYAEVIENIREDNPECIICFIEFDKNDEICELKCDKRHFFHSNCIELWFK